jgi:hypothetical protein
MARRFGWRGLTSFGIAAMIGPPRDYLIASLSRMGSASGIIPVIGTYRYVVFVAAGRRHAVIAGPANDHLARQPLVVHGK